jgi:hypothetical protein
METSNLLLSKAALVFLGMYGEYGLCAEAAVCTISLTA